MEETPKRKSPARTILTIVLVALAGLVLIGVLTIKSGAHHDTAAHLRNSPAGFDPAVEPAPPPVDSQQAQAAEPDKPPVETTVTYANGKTRTLVSLSDGTVVRYTDNFGMVWKLDPPATKDGQYTEADQADVWHRFRANETRIIGSEWRGSARLQDDNSILLTNDDGTTTSFETNGSTITRDASNRITMLQYANGSGRSFDYADDSQDANIVAIDETDAGGALSTWKRVEKDDDAGYQRCSLRTEDSACELSGAVYDMSFDNDTGALTFTNRDNNGITTYDSDGTVISAHT